MDFTPYLEKAIDYPTYLSQIKLQAEKDLDSLGNLKPNLTQYTELNFTRIERWNKKLSVSDQMIEKLQTLKPYYYLVLTEGWCGDAAHSLPVLEKLNQATENIDLKIIFRDQNMELMKKYQFNGTDSIPRIIGIDKQTGEEKFVWGPRTQTGLELLAKYKTEKEYTKDMFYNDLQKSYNKDKGQTIINEIITLHEA